jgi:hypothetical protein
VIEEAVARRDATAQAAGGCGREGGLVVVRLDAEDDVFPLAVVADEAAVTRITVVPPAEDVPAGNLAALFERRFTQHVGHQGRHTPGEIDFALGVADLGADVEAAPVAIDRGGWCKHFGATQEVEIGR